MLEIRFHGRGGQGAVIASEMLASMFFEQGKFVQAFPAFGVERRGAPVLAFTRVDDHPIEIHYGVYNPHEVIVLDETILSLVAVEEGLQEGGTILINTKNDPSHYDQFQNFRVFTLDVNAIANHYNLGTPSLPIVNTAILGAYGAFCGNIPAELVEKVILDQVPTKKEQNAQAALEAFQQAKNKEKIAHGS